MRIKESMLIGLAFALTVYGVIGVFGYNYYTLMFQLYAYVFLAALVAVKASHGSVKSYFSGLKGSLFLLVDEEEKRMKKLFTGEEYKIIDAEKVQ